jgi:hypothetical protein
VSRAAVPYVPSIRDDPDRFERVTDICRTFTLVQYGEDVGRLSENSTGLILGPTDSRLPQLGVYPSKLRGTRYHALHAKLGDFRPGRKVVLSPELYNDFDSNALAVLDATGTYLAAYVNRQTARRVVNRMHEGAKLGALSIQGTGPGVAATGITILIAPSEVIDGLHEARRTVA